MKMDKKLFLYVLSLFATQLSRAMWTKKIKDKSSFLFL